MPRRRSAPLAALSCAVMLLLASCSEAENADSSGTETTTSVASSAAPSPSPSPTPSAEATSDEYVPASADGPAQNVPKPVKPALADEESYEGAQAFLDYLADARAYAWQTGDTSLLRGIVENETCPECFEEYKDIEDHYLKGGWATGGQEEIKIIDKDMPVNSLSLPAPRVQVSFDGIKVWNSKGILIQDEPADSGAEDLVYNHMQYKDDHWIHLMVTQAAI